MGNWNQPRLEMSGEREGIAKHSGGGLKQTSLRARCFFGFSEMVLHYKIMEEDTIGINTGDLEEKMEFYLKRMDKTESVEVEELGRPRKLARRDLTETEDTKEINYVEETAESDPVLDVNDDNRAPVQASEGPAAVAIGIVPVEGVLPDLVPVPEAADPTPEAAPIVPDVSAPTVADYGLPSASRRRRPRKGIPRRSPLF